VVASGFTVNAQNSQITVTVPAGATTGKVTVTTPNGQAVSEFALTITP
jgi:DnaJ-class molecular chaperone